jgi:hypothetical protein
VVSLRIVVMPQRGQQATISPVIVEPMPAIIMEQISAPTVIIPSPGSSWPTMNTGACLVLPAPSLPAGRSDRASPWLAHGDRRR